MPVYDLNGETIGTNSVIVYGKTERGSIANGYSSNADVAGNTRCEKMYRASGSVEIEFESALPNDATIRVVFYDADAHFLQNENVQANSVIVFTMPSNAEFFRFSVISSIHTERTENFCIKSADGKEVYNPNIVNAVVGDSLAFCYKVSDGIYSSGRLLLPPNYSVDGDKVPMIVFVHGSFGMMTWSSKLGAFNEGTYLPYLQYLANEGFAVFDCYPWTDKITVGSNAYNPFPVPLSIRAYLSGIKYVCDRYNVDADAVSLLCKSQGGYIGQWALTQSVFQFRTVCLFAPTNNTNKSRMFFNSDCRQAIVNSYDFEGTSAELSAFVTSGNIQDQNVESFAEKNSGKLISLLPFVQGVTNGSLADFYADSFQSSPLTEPPQWELDLGLPSKPTGAIDIPAFAARKNYVKHSDVPSKFWCALDDPEVSAYGNYAVYYWLQNGGADTSIRIMPTGTGGHHSMDNSPLALKKSGTTALGITYTDIPLAYTEVVDFIRLKCAD